MDINWAQLELEFINTTISYPALADKHGVKLHALKKHGARYKWTEKRLQLSRSVSAKATEKIVETRIDELAECNKDDIKIAKAIKGQVAKQIAKGQQLGEMSPADLRALSSAAETAQRMARLALGASTENNAATGSTGFTPEAIPDDPQQASDAYIRMIKRPRQGS